VDHPRRHVPESLEGCAALIPSFTPMPLARAREPFDHPDWVFELKYDGFRALAFVNGGGTKLISRRSLEYRRFDDLRSEISLESNADDAVLDGEIVKLSTRMAGRSSSI
jgi:bifunctional non-homologous end joining protein LigD